MIITYMVKKKKRNSNNNKIGKPIYTKPQMNVRTNIKIQNDCLIHFKFGE